MEVMGGDRRAAGEGARRRVPERQAPRSTGQGPAGFRIEERLAYAAAAVDSSQKWR